MPRKINKIQDTEGIWKRTDRVSDYSLDIYLFRNRLCFWFYDLDYEDMGLGPAWEEDYGHVMVECLAGNWEEVEEE